MGSDSIDRYTAYKIRKLYQSSLTPLNSLDVNSNYRPVRAVIDTEALGANLKMARRLAENARVMAVVKANAYGHGLNVVPTALAGADALAVASLDDAQELRAIGWQKPICLLAGFFDPSELEIIAELSLQPVIHCSRQLEQLEAWQSQLAISAWVKVDTGMGRLGFSLAEIAPVRERLAGVAAIAEINIMSHLANADSPQDTTTDLQLGRFRSVADQWGCERSLANSAGVMGWPMTHLEWVRPGIMLYGISPFPDKDGAALGLEPAMNLESEIISVREFHAGDPLGYDGTWQCPQDMQAGVVACGYGDGYPRHAPTGTPVWINGARSQLLGRVSMDYITIDLRDIPAKIGDRVVLWGKELSVDEVARAAGTIGYELVCGVTVRVPRIWKQETNPGSE